jgi:hypothetical protein
VRRPLSVGTSSDEDEVKAFGLSTGLHGLFLIGVCGGSGNFTMKSL